MALIGSGDRVLVRTAGGDWLERRALSGPVRGVDFVVVWVCQESEWNLAVSEGREPKSFPWPADAVKPVEAAVSA